MAIEKKVILLVEDSQDDAELALMALNGCGKEYFVHWAQSGEDALDYLMRKGRYAERDPKTNPGLILLDIQLPGVSGLFVLRSIRQSPEFRQLPIVAITSSDAPSDMLEGYSLGVNSFLQKPHDYVEFTYLLEQLCDHWLTNGNLP